MSYFGYIEPISADGWLRIKLTNGLIHPMPEYLRVNVINSANREEFEILEGRWKGKKASVKKKGFSIGDWDGSYFEEAVHTGKGCPHRNSVDMIFHRKSEQLDIPGIGKIKAITDTSNPVPLGTFDIEIPYEPHGLGISYISDAKYAKTWFRIGHSGDRFLHPGRVSAGCITVTETKKWDSIYKKLIVARKDLKSIGTVKVTDT